MASVNWRRLQQPGWSKGEPLEYADWVRCAREYPDQDFVWREHERHARENYRSERESAHVDLGGEG